MIFRNRHRSHSKAPAILTALAAGLALTFTAFAKLNNSGFEFAATQGFPLPQMAVWGFDQHSYVGAEQGITPPSDAKMLRFDATSPNGGGAKSCDVAQWVDLTDWPAIGAWSVIHASVRVNRVNLQGTDSSFYIRLQTYKTLADAQNLTNGTSQRSGYLLADDKLATWETISVEMAIPAGTKYMSVWVGCIENIVDENVNEFKGNYADEVCLDIVTGKN